MRGQRAPAVTVPVALGLGVRVASAPSKFLPPTSSEKVSKPPPSPRPHILRQAQGLQRRRRHHCSVLAPLVPVLVPGVGTSVGTSTGPVLPQWYLAPVALHATLKSELEQGSTVCRDQTLTIHPCIICAINERTRTTQHQPKTEVGPHRPLQIPTSHPARAPVLNLKVCVCVCVQGACFESRYRRKIIVYCTVYKGQIQCY
jgi:hypothetical protein